MKHYIYYLFLSIIFVLAGCGEKGMKKVDLSETKLNDEIIQDVVSELLKTHGEAFRFRIERGVGQVASLWRVSDGNESEFNVFCQEYFIADEDELDKLFQRLLLNYEILGGNMLRMKKDLMRPLHLDLGPILPVDMLFGSYEPGAHMQEDFFENKIAFVVMLNFPYYSLDEKTQSSDKWSRREWAMARIGDYYTSRVPATLIQNYVAINTAADAYIDNYNIYMGNLIDTNGEKLFPADLRLISHWGLRDELKSNYADENGIEKQKMVYAVMKRIIDQTIPEKVINSDSYDWNPFTNQLFDNSESVDFQSEPDRRYEHMLNNFKAQYQLDPYYPQTPNYIQRQFEANMEIPQQDVEKLFVEFVSSPTVNKVAEYIRSQLGRQLEPFDIWFNGFKAGSKYSQEQLDRITMTRYPNVEEVQNDLPRMLRTLGFSILLARYKGPFDAYLNGTPKISSLKEGDIVLILESCTHHVSCEDIGRVKMPNWMDKFTAKKLKYEVVSGLNQLPRPITDYALVVQCGGCMITRKQMVNRLKPAIDAGIPVTNYGMAIAYMQGVYQRAILPFIKKPLN
jgi:hypothetical protein